MDGEVVVERRRQWTPEQKAALLGEVEAEGGQVSVVARRRGVSTSLLYNWRSAWKAAAMAAQSAAVRPAKFVRLGVVADATGESPEGANGGRCGMPAGCRAGVGREPGWLGSGKAEPMRCSCSMTVSRGRARITVRFRLSRERSLAHRGRDRCSSG